MADAAAEPPAAGLEMAQPLAAGGDQPPRGATARPSSAKGWSQQRGSLGSGSLRVGASRQEVEEAVELVTLVTRLTTVTCLILAGLKVAVYLLTGLAVVKTSAIDSIGDLMVTPVSMYTSWKISRADPTAYPAGPGTMAVLGGLVLSSIMAAVMIYNGMNNLAEVFVDQETSIEKATKSFWASIFGVPCSMDESPEWEKLRDGVRHMVHSGKFAMGDLSLLMRSTVNAPDFRSACQEAIDIVKDGEQHRTADSIWFNTLFAVFFLVLCLAYELAIYLYCVISAIPKTGSEVLESLAVDKRNDCIGLCFVIACLLATYWLEDELGEFLAEKMDPISSFVVSAATTVVWVRFLTDQFRELSQGPADWYVFREISTRVESIAGRCENVKVSKITMHRYCASRYVVRVELGVPDPSANCGGVEAAARALSGLEHPSVARLLVCPRAAPHEARAEPRRAEGEEWHLVEPPGGGPPGAREQ